MSKIGIISGGGKLPILIGNSLVKKNYDVVFFIIEDSVERKDYLNLKTVEIKLNSIKKIFKKLEENYINKIILAGNIKRPSIKDINFDFETINFAKKLFLSKKGDNELLISIAKLFQEKGFEYLDWKSYCPELFASKTNLTRSHFTCPAKIHA